MGDGAVALVSRAIAPREHLLETAVALWREHYSRHLLDHTRLYPGIAAVLGSARIPLAVHTNKPGAMARKILDGLGVHSRFVAVVGGDEARPQARPVRPARHLPRALGVSADDTVLVGDSVVDHATARRGRGPLRAGLLGLRPDGNPGGGGRHRVRAGCGRAPALRWARPPEGPLSLAPPWVDREGVGSRTPHPGAARRRRPLRRRHRGAARLRTPGPRLPDRGPAERGRRPRRLLPVRRGPLERAPGLPAGVLRPDLGLPAGLARRLPLRPRPVPQARSPHPHHRGLQDRRGGPLDDVHLRRRAAGPTSS